MMTFDKANGVHRTLTPYGTWTITLSSDGQWQLVGPDPQEIIVTQTADEAILEAQKQFDKIVRSFRHGCD